MRSKLWGPSTKTKKKKKTEQGEKCRGLIKYENNQKRNVLNVKKVYSLQDPWELKSGKEDQGIEAGKCH